MRIGLFKRIMGGIMALVMILSLFPTVYAANNTYTINGNKISVTSAKYYGSGQCWKYANAIYKKIWGHEFSNKFNDSENMLRNLCDSELLFTKEHAKEYISNASIGATIRICNAEYLHADDGWGHSLILVQKDSKGFTTIESITDKKGVDGRRERYWKYDDFTTSHSNLYGKESYQYKYIKYIKWPGAYEYKGDHTHVWTTGTDSGHPHGKYKICTICGGKQYTGQSKTVTTCSSCYPIGTVSLKRSYQKTKGTVTFKRNSVKNATDYTLTVKKDGSTYGTYDMPNTSLALSDLGNGTYTATLLVKNKNTGKTKTAKCDNFTMVNSYEVTYNANGGINAPSAQAKIKGVDLTLSSSIPSREGYDFLGWSRTKKATVPEYTAGGKFTLNTKVTLYAVWTPKTYTVDFNVNGGNGDAESVSITHGNVMRMPNTIVRNNYYLKGWAKADDAQTPDYRLGMDYAITTDMTLYAVWGQSTWDNGTEPFAGGEGTEENPYQIANSKQLAYLANKVNTQSATPSYEYYILTDNIDLGYNEWTPIGLYVDENQYFKGSFDGNGYTISNLSITSLNNGYIGLFGYTKDSNIKNLTVSGMINSITTSDTFHIGAIIGASDNLNAENCTGAYINLSGLSSGTTSENSSVGALFGIVTNGTVINCCADNCFAAVTKGIHTIGMIAGHVIGNITNCSVTSQSELINSTSGTSSGTEQLFCGGIAGSVTGNISKCSVNAKSLSGTIETIGKVYAGGIVGWHEEGSIELCSAVFSDGTEIDGTTYKASIYAKSKSASGSTDYAVAGGIVGVTKLTSIISDCKYDGKSVYASNLTRNSYAGGIIGNDNGLSTTALIGANRCFSNVDGVVYANSARTAGAGGIFGRVGLTNSVIAPATNLLAKADRVIAQTSGKTYTAYVGDICGVLTNGGYSFSNTWSSADMKLSASNSETPANISEANRTNSMPDPQIKMAYMSRQVFGTPYSSIKDLKENPEAVWVIKDGQYPELYFTVLRDITLSEVEHGAISVDKTQAVNDEIVAVTAEPDEGYTLDKIYVNGEKIAGTTFEVKGDSEVYATFAEIPAEYSVEVQATEKAAASLTNVDEVSLQSVSLFSTTTNLTATDGDEIRVDTQSDEDYNVEAVYVNGEEMASDSFIITDNSIVTLDVQSTSTALNALTYEASEIYSNGAVLGGKIEDEDDSSRYILYWNIDNPEEIYTTEVEEGGGEYYAFVTDLDNNTKYEFQMTEFGDIKSFTTSDAEPIGEGVPDEVYNGEETIEHIQREICFDIQNQSKGKFSMSADVMNTTDETQSGLVIYAAYDGSGALVKVEAETITDLAANGTFPAEFAIVDGAEKYKILVWDSWKSMLPIAASVDIE